MSMRIFTAAVAAAATGAVAAGALAWAPSSAPTPAAREAGGAAASATAPAVVGFGEPRTLVSDSGASLESVAVTPNGSVALLWRAADFKRDRYRYRAAVGPNLAGLGRGRDVPAGTRSARTGGDAQLVALPGGGFAACFTADPRRGSAVASCSFAAPGKPFGRERTALRARSQQRLGLTVAARPDGRLAVVASERRGSARILRSLLLSADGTRTPPATVLRTDGEGSRSLAALHDGTLALSTTAVARGELGGRGELRLMTPGAERFGAPVAYTEDEVAGFGSSVSGGRTFAVSYVPGADGRERDERVVVRRPDGSFAAPQSFPRPAPGFLSGQTAVQPDGSPLALVSAEEYNETDCSDRRTAVVGAGPLVAATPLDQAIAEPQAQEAVTAERLSAARQFGLYPRLGTLDDGTVLAVWGNSLNEREELRLEAAFRAPGAARFGAARQVLPVIATDNFILASSGQHAVLVWGAGQSKTVDLLPARIVGADLRTAAPFAKSARRPKRGRVGCS